jgi:hypothetical protein
MNYNNIHLFQEEKEKINKLYLKSSAVEYYTYHIYSKCEKTMPSIKKNPEKISDENLCAPTIKSYDILLRNNYNVHQLKAFAKSYKLKISGNKNELVNRLYVFLKLSSVIIRIQKIFRGNLQRKYNKLHGPAFFKRGICTNQSDFLTIEDMKDLVYSQFFSYKDVDGFVYGFDIISLYNLILKSGKTLKNPYNRNVIPSSVINDIRSLLRISKLLKIPIEIDIKDITAEISIQKSVELRTIDLFQLIDSLGNYSNPSWFLSLSKIQMVKMLRELMDIWNYRAQLPTEVKRMICPPMGEPFRGLSFTAISNEQNMDNVKRMVLDIIERLVKNGIDNDNKALGAYYVLGAITIVNPEAAIALPWLFQSVCYF